MAKVTPVFWRHKVNQKGHSPIYLRISDTDATRYVSLRVYIRGSQWNERTARVRKSHKDADAINNLIAQRIAEVEAEIIRLKTEKEAVTVDHLKDTIAPSPQNKAASDFFVFADTVIDDLERRGQLYTYKRYKSF